jgi:bcr-type benzoyl-CoA reductase subunit A
MKTFVGIDLGSTTTKAVLLDENCDVIGRGITNSRSNYATAARVASEEARIDGRFTLFRRALNAGGANSGDLDEFLGALDRSFRLVQFLEQLDDLEETCRGQVKGERFAKVESQVKDASARCSSFCARKRTTHGRGAIYLDPKSRAALDVGALHGRAISIDERGKVLVQRG